MRLPAVSKRPATFPSPSVSFSLYSFAFVLVLAAASLSSPDDLWKNISSAKLDQYRVTLVVAGLGWVDLYFEF